MRTVDLHTHTTCSDGTYSPRELVEYAKKKGLSAIAITDHDVVDGVEEAKQCGERLGIEVIPGIEVSTAFEGKEIHIVGLFIDIYNEDMNKSLDDMRNKRVERNKTVTQRLQDLGLDISYQDILKTADGNIVTRAHIAKALRNKGYVSSTKEAFERYLGDGKLAYVKREVFSWQDTLSMINNAGGVAVLAHPLIYKMTRRNLENTVAELAENGLKAIEGYYSTFSPSDTKYIKMLADKNKLKISGGSDFHGDNKPGLDFAVGYGGLSVPYSVLEGLKGVIKNG